MSLSEINNDPWFYVEMLWRQITVIEARDLIQKMTVAQSPHLSPKDFRKLKNSLLKKAYGGLDE